MKVAEKIFDTPDVYVVLLPNETDRVYVHITVKGGFAVEKPSQTGLLHLLEHYLIGAIHEYYPSRFSVSGDVILEGSRYSFESEKGRALEDIRDFLGLLFQPNFSHGDVLERERETTINELFSKYESPEEKIFQLLRRATVPGCSYARDVNAELQKTRDYSPKQLEGAHRQYFTSSNILIVVGGYKLEEMFYSALVGAVRELAPAPGKEIAFPSCEVLAGVQLLPSSATESIYANMVFPGLSIKAPTEEIIAMNILCRILTQPSEFGMFDSARKEGIYDVSYDNRVYERFGVVGFRSQLFPEKAAPFVRIVMDSLRRAKEDGLPQKEIDTRRKKAIESSTEDWMSNASRFDWVVGDLEDRDVVVTLDELRELFERVTPAYVKGLANRVFVKERLNLAIAGNTAGLKKSVIEEELEI